jgi:hypothetical protein
MPLATTRSGVIGNQAAEPEQPAGKLDPHAVRDQAQRLLADPLFRNSKRYSNLLRFIVDRTLDGQTQDLKERIIGIEVFGRAPDYDTSLDPTVRVAATEVRKRLALYYKEPGRESEIRIELPHRSYIAEFRMPEPPAAPEVEPHTDAPVAAAPAVAPARRSRWKIAAFAAALVLAAGLWLVPRVVAPHIPLNEFWAPLLDAPGAVSLVISSPPVAPLANTAGPSDSAMRMSDFVRRRGDVAMNDVSAASSLSAFLARRGKDAVVRPARGASLADLRSGSSVLLGAYNNDWVLRFGESYRFRFRRESDFGLRWIEDRSNPGSRDWAVNLSTPYEQVSGDYALISRALDQTTGRWLVGISGLTGFATAAVTDMVMDAGAMTTFAAHLPPDWAKKNIQVVLAVKMVNGSPGAPQVIAVEQW